MGLLSTGGPDGADFSVYNYHDGSTTRTSSPHPGNIVDADHDEGSKKVCRDIFR